MTPQPKRHWTVFAAIWSLAALSFLLFLPIYVLTFYFKTPPDPMLPDVFLENSMASGMRVAIAAACMVAVWQTVDARFSSLRKVLAAQLVVWGGLGLFLAALWVFKPLPPPLVATVGARTYEVPRSYYPELYTRVAPFLRVSLCRGSLGPTYRAQDCDRVLVSIRQAPKGEVFLGSEKNLARMDLSVENGALVGLPEAGELIETVDGLRHYKVARDGQTYWYHFTVDATGQVTRAVGCFRGSDRCKVNATTSLGAMGYEVPFDASQSLAAREADERAFVGVFEALAR